MDFPADCTGSKFILLPGASKFYVVGTSKEEIEITAENKSYLYILGFIKYSDSTYDFWTKGCWYWDIVLKQFADCADHNSLGKIERAEAARRRK
jgi:hypothetical protein